jgi:coenzyme F420 hydrogenase subunit beta
MAEKRNISEIVGRKLCATCGACFAVCKAGAIEYEETMGGYYFPVIDGDRCVECGLCFAVCPGIAFGRSLMETMPSDPFAGRALEAFVGRATDRKMYENSQSGGVVSALLAYVLESGLADAAVTVGMDWGAPPRPKVLLAKSVDDIISAQKSKYCPVPTLSVLREVPSPERKIAFVGTPCQVHGLLNIAEKVPDLKKQIVLIVGLVCDRVMTYAALDFLVSKAKLTGREAILEFRDKSCGGYPGKVHIRTPDDRHVVMPASARTRLKDLFTPARCRICFDKMNVFSDIVVGDPHGVENVDRKQGESIAVLRTARGRTVFREALESNVLAARETPYQAILAGQRIDLKRIQWQGYVCAWKRTGNALPNYCERVAPGAGGDASGPYRDNLNHSLSLDGFSSRAELFRSIDRRLLRQEVLGMLLRPLKTFKRRFHSVIAFMRK